MKLRIRSVATKETIKLEAPTPCSLRQLKTLVSARVSAPSSSIRLSLNRTDELSSDDDDSLQSLGLTSGDLLFLISDAGAFTPERPEIFGESPVATTDQAVVPMETSDADGREAGEGDGEEEQEDVGKGCLFSIPGFLKRVIMEEEAAYARGDLGILLIAVHAVFLESGFVVHGGNGSRLPEGWASPAPVVMISYTVPELEGQKVDPVKVKVSLLGKYANVYGSMSRSPDVFHVCINMSRFVPSVASSIGDMSEKDEGEVFELWKTVKDMISLPLLIDFSEKNELPPPPCFTRLPTELKCRILELLPGGDLARVGCVNSELRYLSSNDELWGKKFVEEFEPSDGKGLFGRRWKDKFITCWEKKKCKWRPPGSSYTYGVPSYWRRPVPFGFPWHNITGGDYDRFPAIRGMNPGGSGQDIRRFLPRRNFSPHCNLGRFNG